MLTKPGISIELERGFSLLKSVSKVPVNLAPIYNFPSPFARLVLLQKRKMALADSAYEMNAQ